MAIDPVSQLQAGLLPTISGVGRTTQRPGDVAAPGGAAFGNLFSEALGRLNQLQQEADSAATSLAAGEQVDVHDVMIAVQKADLGFQLAIQVRNKLVEAYQEVMRITV